MTRRRTTAAFSRLVHRYVTQPLAGAGFARRGELFVHTSTDGHLAVVWPLLDVNPGDGWVRFTVERAVSPRAQVDFLREVRDQEGEDAFRSLIRLPPLPPPPGLELKGLWNGWKGPVDTVDAWGPVLEERVDLLAAKRLTELTEHERLLAFVETYDLDEIARSSWPKPLCVAFTLAHERPLEELLTLIDEAMVHETFAAEVRTWLTRRRTAQ